MADPRTYSEEEYNTLAQEKQALIAKRDEVLSEAKAAKTALKAYEGIDPTKAKALQKAADDAEAAAAAARGDFTAREKQLVERHAEERKGDAAKAAKLMSAVQKRTAEAEIRRAIAKAKGDVELLLPHAMPFVKVRETDDDFEAFLEDKGQPLVADGQGTPMSFDTFVTERLMVKFPGAFEGTGSSGGGAARSIASGVGVRVIPAGDPVAFGKNAADIASGKAEVR